MQLSEIKIPGSVLLTLNLLLVWSMAIIGLTNEDFELNLATKSQAVLAIL